MTILGDTVAQVKSTDVLDYCYHTSKSSRYLITRSGHQDKEECINEEEIKRSEKRTSLSTDNYQRAFVALLGRVLSAGRKVCVCMKTFSW